MSAWQSKDLGAGQPLTLDQVHQGAKGLRPSFRRCSSLGGEAPQVFLLDRESLGRIEKGVQVISLRLETDAQRLIARDHLPDGRGHGRRVMTELSHHADVERHRLSLTWRRPSAAGEAIAVHLRNHGLCEIPVRKPALPDMA